MAYAWQAGGIGPWNASKFFSLRMSDLSGMERNDRAQPGAQGAVRKGTQGQLTKTGRPNGHALVVDARGFCHHDGVCHGVSMFGGGEK
jgi:hypothetical protein